MKNLSFMTKTICCLMSVVLLTLLISAAISVPRLRKILQTNYNDTMSLTLDMVRQNIENTLNHYERIACSINGNDELNNWLLNPEPSENLNQQKLISRFLSASIIGDRYIRSVVIHCTDGRIYSYSRYNELGVKYLANLIDPAKHSVEKHGGFQWAYDATLLPLSPAESKENRLLLTGVIKNRSDVYKNEVIATFVMEYDVNVLSHLYESEDIDGLGEIVLWDSNAPAYPIVQQVKRPPETALRKEVEAVIQARSTKAVEWNQLLILSRPVEKTGWNLVGMVDTETIHTNIAGLEQDLYLVLLLEFAIAVLCSLMLAFQITKPIKRMIACMKKVEEGDLRVQIPVDRRDELGKLSLSFNHMMAQLDDLIHEVYEVKASEREAQITAMRAQMNPHFLYNTLDAINWTVSFGENEQACEMITCLSDVLRYSIKGSAFVTVHSEIQQAANYLFIQKKRMGEALQYDMDIHEEIIECKVLKFFLQPIVENAIIHGLSGCGYLGKISISARMEKDDLLITVSDNGRGIDPERIGDILSGGVKSDEEHTGIGLSNVDKRIKLIYANDRYGVQIKSGSTGTCVTVTLPVRF